MSCETCIKNDVCAIKRIVEKVDKILDETVFAIPGPLPGQVSHCSRNDLIKKYDIILITDCQHFR